MPEENTRDDSAVAVEQPAGAPSAPQPSTDGQPEATPTASPESSKTDTRGIPEDRHKAILESTRADYESRLSRLSWAERHDPDRVSEALRLADLYERAPERLYRDLGERVKTPEAPKPDLVAEDGVPIYSAQQAAALARYEAHQAIQELKAEFEDRYGPVEQEVGTWRTTRTLNDQIAVASQWPGFKDHVDAITSRIAQANARGEQISLHDAYIQVVVPQLAKSKDELSAEIRKAVLDELNNTSAVTRQDVHPRSPSPSQKPDSEKSIGELYEEEMAKVRKSA